MKKQKNFSNVKNIKAIVSLFVISFFFCAIDLAAQDARYIIARDSTFTKKTILSGDAGLSINKVAYWNLNDQKIKTVVKQYLALNANLNLSKKYSLMVSLYYYLNRKELSVVPWLPDFALNLRRDGYLPNTLFWGYSNYGDNRFSNSFQRELDILSTGTFYLGYRVKIPDKIMKLIKVDSTSSLVPMIQFNYATNYFTQRGEIDGGLFKGKPVGVITLQYLFLKMFYVYVSGYYYPVSSVKMPWDTDYSYGLGLTITKPWQFTFSYLNVTNKFPWSKGSLQSGFLYGNFTVGMSYQVNYRRKK
jgi:hypothetical protein